MSARNHHYLSQFYLRGFAERGGDESWVHVLDLDQRKTFKTKPRNLAAVRDFNRVDLDGHDPNVLENQMAQLESSAAQAWTRVHEGAPFEGEDRELVLTMAALQHIRTPERREMWRQTQAHSAEVVMDMVLSSEERWNAHVRRAREAGADLPEVSYAEAKRFHEEKAYRIDVSRESHLHMEFVGLDAVVPLLLARHWQVLRTDPQTEPFITSDQPTYLAWIHPEDVPPIHRNHPGHGFKDTRVWYPMSSELAIVGEFDGPLGERRVGPDVVAIVNLMTIRGSRRRLYAPTLDFHFLDHGFEVRDGRHLLEKMQESGT